MFGLPHTTEFNKRIPKNKFYEKLSVNSALKKIFVEQIKNIVWTNKIAENTVNIKAGKTVTEIEVIEILLYEPELDVAVLKLIDSYIAYHIIFALKHNEKYQLWTAYKEATKNGESAFKVDTYYHTEWLEENEIKLDFKGFSLDDVYENFVKSIAGQNLSFENTNLENLSLSETVEASKRREELIKHIEALKNKIRKERQFNVQVRLNAELKQLTTALNALK